MTDGRLPSNEGLDSDDLFEYTRNGITYDTTFRDLRAHAIVGLSSPGGDWVSVVDYGATGDGVTDDTTAIASAITAAKSQGGGTVYFPQGTYIISEVSTTGACINIDGVDNVVFLGAGIGATVIKLADGQRNSTRGFVNKTNAPGNSDNLTFRSLTMDGNTAGQDDYSANPQQHALRFYYASNIRIENVECKNWSGDGIYFLDGSENCKVDNCSSHDNLRRGITIGGSVDKLTIADCWLYNNLQGQQIDFEPSSGDAVDNVTLIGNYLDEGTATNYATVLATSSARYGKNWRVIGNTFISNDEGVRFIYLEDIIFKGNYLIHGDATASMGIEVYNGNGRVIIDGNIIVSPNAGGASAAAISVYGTTSAKVTEQVIISNNIVDMRGATTNTQNTGINLRNCESALITGNQIIGGGGGPDGWGIRSRNTVGDSKAFIIKGNYLENTGVAGVFINNDDGYSIGQLVVDGNTIIDNQGTATVLVGVGVNDSAGNVGQAYIGTNLFSGIATEYDIDAAVTANMRTSMFGADNVGQQSDPGALTDSTGGTTDDTLAAISGSGADTDINNNFAELAEDVETLRTALANVGLIG